MSQGHLAAIGSLRAAAGATCMDRPRALGSKQQCAVPAQRLRCVKSWHGDTVRHCTHCTTGMDGRCRAWPGVAPKLLNVASEVPSVACKAYCMAQTSEMSQVCQLHYWQHSICCIHGRHTCNQSVGPAAPCCFCCCCCVHGVLTRSALGMQPLKKPTRPSSACIRRKQSTTPLYCEGTNDGQNVDAQRLNRYAKGKGSGRYYRVLGSGRYYRVRVGWYETMVHTGERHGCVPELRWTRCLPHGAAASAS